MKGIKNLFEKIRRTWIRLTLKLKSLFSFSNFTKKQNDNHAREAGDEFKLGNKQQDVVVDEALNLKDEQYDASSEQNLEEDEFYDALGEEPDLDEDEFYDALDEGDAVGKVEENMNEQVAYADGKFYSTKDLKEVDKFTNHANTFACALFEPSITKYPDAQGNYNLVGLQLKPDESKIDKSKAGKCTLDFEQCAVDLHHVRLLMPFFFEEHAQESINDLFQYTDKEGEKHTPSVVILLDRPESINLNPQFRLTEKINSFGWKLIKRSEKKKSTRITEALLPTFEVKLEGENLNFIIKKDAILGVIEDLKKEKPTLQKIFQYISKIPGAQWAVASLTDQCSNVISNIIDKITSKQEKTNFRVRDVLMNGAILNELQKSRNAQLNDRQHADFEDICVEQAVQMRGLIT